MNEDSLERWVKKERIQGRMDREEWLEQDVPEDERERVVQALGWLHTWLMRHRAIPPKLKKQIEDTYQKKERGRMTRGLKDELLLFHSKVMRLDRNALVIKATLQARRDGYVLSTPKTQSSATVLTVTNAFDKVGMQFHMSASAVADIYREWQKRQGRSMKRGRKTDEVLDDFLDPAQAFRNEPSYGYIADPAEAERLSKIVESLCGQVRIDITEWLSASER